MALGPSARDKPDALHKNASAFVLATGVLRAGGWLAGGHGFPRSDWALQSTNASTAEARVGVIRSALDFTRLLISGSAGARSKARPILSQVAPPQAKLHDEAGELHACTPGVTTT